MDTNEAAFYFCRRHYEPYSQPNACPQCQAERPAVVPDACGDCMDAGACSSPDTCPSTFGAQATGGTAA